MRRGGPDGGVLRTLLIALGNRFFLQTHEPQISFVNSLNVSCEYGLVGILDDRGLVVALFQARDDLVQLINFSVHDTEIADSPDFFDAQPALFNGLRTALRIHRSANTLYSDPPVLNTRNSVALSGRQH